MGSDLESCVIEAAAAGPKPHQDGPNSGPHN